MKVAVIPAAGKGVRFHELGKNYQKTLLPYDGIPIIQRIIDRLLPDFDEIRVVIGNNSELLLNYLEQIDNPKIKTLSVSEEGRQGPARSFMEAVNGDESAIFLHLSDVIFNFHFTDFSTDWVSVTTAKDPNRWCMINKKSHFMDKPQRCPEDYRAMTGAYFFTNPRFLKQVCDRAYSNKIDSEFQLSEVLQLYKSDYPFRLDEHDSKKMLDFGTIEEFFKNNRSNKSRFFNIITYSKDRVKKSSPTQPNKVLAEAIWMRCAPSQFQPYIPKIYKINIHDASYEMERMHSVNLRDLFIHLDRSSASWSPIINKVKEFLSLCRGTTRPAPFWAQVCEKTLLRRPDLSSFVASLTEAIADCSMENESTFFHGDLHFNNMFFDFNAEKLTLIDPNGAFFGHWLYDVSKLTHSMIGKFDFIDTRLFNLNGAVPLVYSSGTGELEDLFRKQILDDLTPQQLRLVYKTTASLFASMQPLHKDFPEKTVLFEAAFESFNRLADSV
jgi:dTDP-glucose pyrophosphorylase